MGVIMSKDKEHLQYIYNRLWKVHGENKRVGYMVTLRAIIDGMDTPKPKKGKASE